VISRVLCCLLALGLISCSGERSEKKALLWARSADSSTLDPAEVEWGEDAKITQNLYDPLVTFGHDSVDLVPGLAERWSLSPDGKRVTFDLRKGVRFHDGTAFDAAAVIFTFERLMNPSHPHKPKIAPPYGPCFADIETVSADGSLRVIFTLKRPSAVILHNLTLFGASIVSPTAVKKHGHDFSRNPCGTGPYRLARWDRDTRIVLDRFDGYWGAQPAVERVIVLPVKSPQTAIAKLRKGEVHVVDHPTLADVSVLRAGPNTRVDTETSLNVCYLGFNLKKFPYNDLHFRRAISLALDRNTLNSLAYYGLAEPASNIVPPAIWKSATPDYEYDIGKAKESLAKVKLPSNQVELIHMTFARPYLPEPIRVAEFVKDQLRKIGLDVKLTGYDKAAYTQKYKEEGHPMYLLGWTADIPDPDNFFHPLLHGDSKKDMNGSFFDDPEFNAAVTEAQSELDPARRRALYAKAYARTRAELPIIPLVHVKQIIALSDRVAYDMHPIEVRFALASFKE
jgi:peptide/nickel transport system substrate-binding protein